MVKQVSLMFGKNENVSLRFAVNAILSLCILRSLLGPISNLFPPVFLGEGCSSAILNLALLSPRHT